MRVKRCVTTLQIFLIYSFWKINKVKGHTSKYASEWFIFFRKPSIHQIKLRLCNYTADFSYIYIYIVSKLRLWKWTMIFDYAYGCNWTYKDLLMGELWLLNKLFINGPLWIEISSFKKFSGIMFSLSMAFTVVFWHRMAHLITFNSLTPVRCFSNLKSIIFRLTYRIVAWSLAVKFISDEYHRSLLMRSQCFVKVMALRCQATSHHLKHCRPRSMSTYF